jgi:hypothetical protein
MEAILCGTNQAKNAGADATARITASVLSWIKTNTSKATAGSPADPTTATGTGTRTDGTQLAFTEGRLKTVLQSAWTNGGKPDTIFTGAFNEIKEIMGRSRELGMATFDWALFDLYEQRVINFEEAIRNADSANELRLNIKLRSKRGEPSTFGQSSALSLNMGSEDEPPGKIDPVEELRLKSEARHKAEDAELARMREKRRLAEAAISSQGR